MKKSPSNLVIARIARRLVLLVLLVLLVGPSCQTGGRPEPAPISGVLPASLVSPVSLVLHNGKIWTGGAEAQAIAIIGERIVAVGQDSEILSMVGPHTSTIDLERRRVVPGFIDSHVHFLSGGSELLGADLRDATSEEEFARRLGERVARLAAGTWVTSGTWDHENWPGAREPTREILDRFTPEHPVFVDRLDGHMGLANTLALEAAGITRDTADPPGGKIVRDPQTGEPTGLLKDAAMSIVSRRVPPLTRDQRRERIEAALRHAAELGLTGVHDMLGGSGSFDVYQELRREGTLTTRVTLYQPIAAHSRWRDLDIQRGLGDRFLRVNGFKAFADGSLGSRTALFFEPYLDDPATRGLAQADLSAGGELEKTVSACVDANLQVATHGIGDRAIRALLDIYERTTSTGERTERLRIEHAQHIHPDDLDRFGELGVIASMQPFHCIDDGRWAEKRIDRKRCETTYAFRDLIDRDASIAFGSDWPVASLSPLRGIHAAVTRSTLDGKHPDGWIPAQKITVKEALRAYTQGSAYAGFAEHDVGSLETGKLADIVVLDRDILAIDPQEIARAHVLMTILGGRVVYLRVDEPAR